MKQCQKVADHLAALAIEAPRFSNHLRTGAAGLLAENRPMNAVQSVVTKLFRKPNGNLPTRQHSVALDGCNPPPRIDNFAAAESCWVMTDQQDDPLAQFGLDAIDLRWTLKDIDSKRAPG
jgi:hypothetical protein